MNDATVRRLNALDAQYPAEEYDLMVDQLLAEYPLDAPVLMADEAA